MKKWQKRTLFLLLTSLVIGFVGIHYIAPYGILKPTKRNLNLNPKELNLESSKIKIDISETEQLQGYWIESKQATTLGVMILIHGIGGCKEHFLGTASHLADIGIASIVFDNRAHGESGGAFCTYGYYEKKDISKIVDFVESKSPDLKVGIWGNSLGGAIAIQALEYDERIQFGIIESTFTEFRTIVFDYKKRILKGIGIPFIANYAVDRAGVIAGFDPDEVSPLNAVKNIEQPVFIAHGDADKNISVEYGKSLFKNLKAKDKKLEIVKGGGHFGLYETGGKQYEDKLMAFMLNHF